MKFKILAMLFLLALATPAAQAADLHPMDRFIDEDAFWVFRWTPDKDDAKVFDFFIKLFPGDEAGGQQAVESLRKQQKMITLFMEQCRNLGLREGYMMGTLSEGLPSPNLFYLVMRMKPEAKVEEKALKRLLAGLGYRQNLQYKQIDKEYWLIGAESIIKRIESQKPAAHPRFWKALEMVDGSFVKAVIVPPDHFRRVVGEMMPTLPKSWGGGPSTILTDGVQAVAVGLSVSHELRFELKIQSKNPQAAGVLRDWTVARFRGILELIEKDIHYLDHPSKYIEPIVECYRPAVDGDRVCFELKGDTDQMKKLIDALRAPIFASCKAYNEKRKGILKLREVGLAILNYVSSKPGGFPSAVYRDKEGKPLLSWRVHVLPYLEGGADLYKQFKLDEPWDSPNNKKLIAKMPACYRTARTKPSKPGMANILVAVGPGTIFPEDRSVRIAEIADGTSRTIMLVEVDQDAEVIWTKPDDLKLDPKNPKKHLTQSAKGKTTVLMADCSHREINLKRISNEALLRMFLRDDEYGPKGSISKKKGSR